MTESIVRPPEVVGEYLAILSREHCRDVIAYFHRRATETATVDDLAEFASRRTARDEDAAEIRLHHSTLPQLADADVLDYDSSSKTVRYRGNETLEELLDRVSERGGPAGSTEHGVSAE